MLRRGRPDEIVVPQVEAAALVVCHYRSSVVSLLSVLVFNVVGHGRVSLPLGLANLLVRSCVASHHVVELLLLGLHFLRVA